MSNRRSRYFKNYIPKRGHLVRGKQGVGGEVTDLRNDVDGTFQQYESEGNLSQNNPNATVNPGPNDDETQGYSILSFWLNTVSDDVFVCTDPSAGVAVWKETTLTFAGASLGSVKSRGNSSPPGPPPSVGDAYIVNPPGAGLWAGHDNELATWNGVAWTFYVSQTGDRVWVEDETRNYIFNGTAWALPEDYLDHNILQNLDVGDVHTQYQLRSEENAANGYAGLDASGEVADAQHGSRSGAALHALVTLTVNGFMSAVDKVKLNGVDTGATNTPLSDTDPVGVTKSAAQEGTATEASRQDHKHDVSTGTPADVGSANAEGSATSLARSDHVHNHANQAGGAIHAVVTVAPAANGFMSSADKTRLNSMEDGATNTPASSSNPANVTKAAAAPGVDTTVSRRDHKHDVTAGVPSDIGSANVEGTGSALVRVDHVHSHANQGGGALHAAALPGAAGFMSAADKTKLNASGVLSATAPVNVTKSAGQAGTASEASRQDHKHDVTTATPVAVGVANSEGSSGSLARADHVHQGDGTGDVDGPGSAVDKGMPSFNGTSGKIIQDTGLRNYGASATDPASPAPADGDIYYNTAIDMWMAYDVTRTKWLSIAIATFQFGRNNNNTPPGSYYRGIQGLILSATRGYKMDFNGTIVAMGYTRDDSDSATFEITEGGTARASLASTAVSGRDNTLNGDFSQDGVLAARNQTGGNPVTAASGWFRVRWRV